ncbi:MAG: tol-pal system protein YbgF [Acidiferrobacterales bacterium]
MPRFARVITPVFATALLALASLPLALGQQSPQGEVTLSRQSAMDLLAQMEALQAELRELRNAVEMQAHEVERLKAAQRELLLDIDQRLATLEGGATRPSATAPPPAAAPGTVTVGTTAPRTTTTTTTTAPPSTTTASAPPATATAPAVAAPVPTRTSATPQEQREYDAAFTLLKQGLYTRASQAFHAFIEKYPNSSLAGNAQYWTAEANYVVRNFGLALQEFDKVVTLYPQSAKVADALLKMGYSYYELKRWEKARETLSDVVTRYPNTTVARLAEIRLAKMKEEGH